MSSTRASSPMSESGATSPAPLTPNSKVKALMATFDDDDSSDDGILPAGPARARVVSALTRRSPAKDSTSTESRPSEHPTGNFMQESVESASEEDEEDIVRPKGRMAARMQANSDSSEEDGEPSAGNARERVRKMLMSKNKSSSPKPTTHTEEADASSENDSPVPRKRKLRVARAESSPARRSASPGLFVSPTKSTTSDVEAAGSASDADLPDTGNARFQALVAKKREERQAKDAEAARETAKKAEARRKLAATLEDDDSEDSEGDRRLMQSSRPARKASKKALEEMHRETQRLSRNMQLAHKATTKKKFTKADFFAKFNRSDHKEVTPEPPRPTSSSSAAPPSDLEHKDTPPTSPVTHATDSKEAQLLASHPTLEDAIDGPDEELQNLDEAMRIPSFPPTRLNKGKGKVIEKPTLEPEAKVAVVKKPLFTQRPVRVRVAKVADRRTSLFEESDSDLEIISAKAIGRKQQDIDSIFDRVPAKLARESHSIHTLRMLAGVTSPGKQQNPERKFGRNAKPSLTNSELQMSLQQRARQQATREREERIQALRDKGVVVQTAEEREKELAEVEDIVARARRDDEALAKREKALAKKERKERGEADPLGDDSSDDEDYKDSEGVPDEEASASGSEEEDERDEESVDGSGEEAEDEREADGHEPEAAVANSMFDGEAAESADEWAEDEVDLSIHEDMADEDEEEELATRQKTRRFRNAIVISDDEDDDEQEMQEHPPALPQVSPPSLGTKSPMIPTSVLRSATKTFIPGVTVAGPAGLGLTQIFAGTMDDSQAFGASATFTESESQEVEFNQNKMDFLRRLKAPELPPFVPTLEEDTQDAEIFTQTQLTYVPNSQPVETETQGGETQIRLDFSQSQIHEFDSVVHGTQVSQFAPTQDVGYQHLTPIKGRFVDGPPSTADTFVLEPIGVPATIEKTPIVKKKGKLRQRAQVAKFSDDDISDGPVEEDTEGEDFGITADAFDVMRKATKKAAKKVAVDEFDKKKSKAKEMVHEQADESEDEYAGLGGASDDESDGEADEFVKELIDDEGGKSFDERKLAAFFADRERASDEKQIEKLYKDITNGMLRRKRGADYDLSDSDDGGEAKQRRKRRQFAKMRKALLADERIGKIAENPKRQAFLRAIEDRGSDDELGFLDDFVEQEEETDSQSQSQSESTPAEAVPMGPHKRKHDAKSSELPTRAPPHLRRTKPAKRPSNLSEIRESLSSLIEEPNALLAPSDSGSESEGELQFEEGDDDLSGPRKEKKEKGNRDPFALRRSSTAVVDRISLKRQSSSTVSNSAKLAFSVSSTTQGFKVPALLRRATTNNSMASSSSSSVSNNFTSGTERMAGGMSGEGVRRGGGRNSGVNFAARELERRAAVVKTDKRREERLVGRAEKRRKVVGGLFGGGKFE
ncbi:uncharacterized protein L3040_005812 [Drepanopeziza brunnea f. sp. 'multigermtubi']|uniref:MRC1-like domain-containing protein n=1 Tax=Marssonina brunnea f. sp. multigermtubi (strain MB_m1) TaxID=1072389 RepID=K1WW89_MARBU|nr:MRC1-like domain-containing protein [Drepanopeziza brunnea f. sp. 'multigermtubi' MB_m1]EKD12953.1 MRC1-like domain-containing protein [Drepanopeziza brunnea f. sp. 'multigermtubi' MB_m1]KAJ5041264.1 hypothetical protein L3040_005812 [Drepanopeziza brunnea f. sp. 'multigermtubi']